MKQILEIDVLSVGHASSDLIFTVDYHSASDEKVLPIIFWRVAVNLPRIQEFIESGVNSRLIVRGDLSTLDKLRIFSNVASSLWCQKMGANLSEIDSAMGQMKRNVIC